VAVTGTIEALPDGRRTDLDLKPAGIDVVDISSLLETRVGRPQCPILDLSRKAQLAYVIAKR
jgi:hypothetical protein